MNPITLSEVIAMDHKFDQAEYIRQYQRENRIEKKVTFNRNNPDDMALLEWLQSRPDGMVHYIKTLIRSDMISHLTAGE